MIVIDTEVYKDYFLLAAKHLGSGKIKTFEMYAGHQPDLPAIKKLMQSTTISFNGLNFDLILIAALLDGADCAKLKSICDTIIKGKQPGWLVAKNLKINLNRAWDHIDLIEVAPGRVSLKVYGARLGCATLQDLPIDPGASISPAQRRLLVDYCANDLALTELLYDQLRPQIALREKMGDQYSMDLRSKSDAQIAETIITSELERLTKNPVAKPDTSRTEFKYQNPGIVTFETPALQELLQRILATTFTLGGNGAVVLPKWLRDSKIRVGDRDYQMGIGGLHSCEKTQYLTADADHVLCDLDVASYYPNIILQQALAPESLGKPFLDVYQRIVNRRMAAKRAGDEVTAYTLKIAVNGSFGKLGSVYSKLYAPELLIQTTITGQMCLLMLIERMSAAGIDIRSANTDGIVCYYHPSLAGKIDEVSFDWMMDTSYALERTDYVALASRDVNNYVAVKPDNSTKGKGLFADTGIAKNPDMSIIATAVARRIAHGTDIGDTIRGCLDPLQFVSVRKVTGGAMWRNEPLGKAVRFYWSREGDAIQYATNGNLVPKSSGAKPLMVLSDFDRADVDEWRYIAEANKLLKDVGA